MSSTWVSDYESAVEVANDTLTLIQVTNRFIPLWHLCANVLYDCDFTVWVQERDLKHGGVGPEASRLAATARRKLGTLGTLIENLRTTLELRDDENL